MAEMKPSSEFAEDGARWTSTGCGELGLALEKHLAGWPLSISEADFFAWAITEDLPTGDHREALREALLIMDADETRRALFDGRASKRQIAKLVVRCGGDENRLWNNLLRLTNPELKVRELPYDLLWDKEMMWGSGWR